jgi:hypothetical protein
VDVYHLTDPGFKINPSACPHVMWPGPAAEAGVFGAAPKLGLA